MVPVQHHQRLLGHLRQNVEPVLVVQGHHAGDPASEGRQPRCVLDGIDEERQAMAEDLRAAVSTVEVQGTQLDDRQLPDLRPLHASLQLQSAADAERGWRADVARRVREAKQHQTRHQNALPVDLRQHLEVHSRRRSESSEIDVGKERCGLPRQLYRNEPGAKQTGNRNDNRKERGNRVNFALL